MNNVYFQGEKLTVNITTYSNNNRIAIQLVDEDGAPYMTASVNTEYPIADDEIVIKDYSENKGIFAALQVAGIITGALYGVHVGYAGLMPVVKLREVLAIPDEYLVDKLELPRCIYCGCVVQEEKEIIYGECLACMKHHEESAPNTCASHDAVGCTRCGTTM